ncbi:hypothetical protein [Ketogulonicigenium vulgare]|uniref:hypothetical protein n=1 Tax=Ketogulonicigenium vulgare TaxID=92945 RepID=UPI0023594892|nr:hypothetical protein [Ketogulonicigenium vulgare]
MVIEMKADCYFRCFIEPNELYETEYFLSEESYLIVMLDDDGRLVDDRGNVVRVHSNDPELFENSEGMTLVPEGHKLYPFSLP